MANRDADLSILSDMRFGGCKRHNFAVYRDSLIRRPARQDHATFYYVRRGQMWVEIDDHLPVLVEEGSIAVLNRWYAHELRSSRTTPGEVCRSPAALDQAEVERLEHDMAVRPDTSVAASVFSSEGATIDSPFKGLLPYFVLIDRDQIAAIPRFKPLLDLYQLAARDDELQSLIDARLDELLALILLSCGMRDLPATPGCNPRLNDERIRQVLIEMHEHPEVPWSVSDLSAKANLSRSGFIDRFKAVMGDTPMNYLTRVRIERAASMLPKGALPISTISYRVGYSSEAAFHRAFKKIFKENPGDYRRRLRNHARPASPAEERTVGDG